MACRLSLTVVVTGDGGSAADPGVTYLVVIHDRVERLNPHGVYVPVQDNPLGTIVGDVGQVPHDGGEQAWREAGW